MSQCPCVCNRLTMGLPALVVALGAATACGRIGYEMLDDNNEPIGTSTGPAGAGGALPPVTTGSAGSGFTCGGGASRGVTIGGGSTGVGTTSTGGAATTSGG